MTLKKDDQDSAAGVPKSVVVSHQFDWTGDCKPETALADSVIYEVHVKGYSKRNPMVPESLRGTYAGLAHPASINYLKQLGVTAVELLPVHHFIDDGHLVDQGLSNYWGYNTLGYFAPMARYSSCGDSGGQVEEFKQMVKDLHAAGPRSDPGRGVQPHVRRQPVRAQRSRSRAYVTPRTTGWSTATAATTWTTRVRETR